MIRPLSSIVSQLRKEEATGPLPKEKTHQTLQLMIELQLRTTKRSPDEHDDNPSALKEGRKRDSSLEGDLPRKKVAKKNYRHECSAEGCTNKVVQGGVCFRHGAKRKLCSSEGCTNMVVQGGVCMRHGAKVKLCSSEGCTNQVRRGGVCRKHGAKIKLCSSEGCTNQVVEGGVCIRHGANRL
eukprot:scaffold37388_cov146-Skeletonema_marinoi.AAC.2